MPITEDELLALVDSYGVGISKELKQVFDYPMQRIDLPGPIAEEAVRNEIRAYDRVRVICKCKGGLGGFHVASHEEIESWDAVDLTPRIEIRYQGEHSFVSELILGQCERCSLVYWFILF